MVVDCSEFRYAIKEGTMKIDYLPLLTMLILILFSNCSQSIQDLHYGAEKEDTLSSKPNNSRGHLLSDYESKKEIESVKSNQTRDDNFFDLNPWVDNKDVQRWIKYYQGRGKYGLIGALKRGEKYRPMIEAVFLDRNLPVDFYYLALIESSYVSHARSHAGAVGIWQFMQATGKSYGLRVNRYVDERKDPIRATVAAANYIADLHRVFQSWFLTLSAYSSGEGRVLRAIMRKETRDFWKLSERKALPRETRNYIPKLIAAIYVARHLEANELAGGKTEFVPPLQGVKVASGVSLNEIARHAKIPVKNIKQYNPHLSRGVIPPGTSSYQLWLPKTLVNSSLELAMVKLRPASGARSYRVKRGDSLYAIAQRFGTSVRSLKRANKMARNRIFTGQVLKIPASS